MGNVAIQHTRGFGGISERSNFSFLERVILRRSHPVSIIFDVIGLIWMTYFLWQNNWRYALAAIVAERIVAVSTVWRIDFDALAATTLGKLGLLHLHPFNLIIQIIGTAGTIWALWNHSTLYILAGLSLIILGHSFGWSQVNPIFSLYDKVVE